MILHSQDEANRACEREGWVTIHTDRQLAKAEAELAELAAAVEAAREANLDAYGRNHTEVVSDASEGPDGDPFGGFPKDGQP